MTQPADDTRLAEQMRLLAQKQRELVLKSLLLCPDTPGDQAPADPPAPS